MTERNNQPSTPNSGDLAIPAVFDRVVQPAHLMPGESLADYNALRDMIIEELSPQSGIEWLWVADLVELSWEIIRYRTLRQEMLHVRRQDAIEAMLQRIDLTCIPPADRPAARDQIRFNSDQWRNDPTVSAEIEARLGARGIDDSSVNAEVLIQAKELLILFDNLMQSAQARRIVLLREINRRRISLEIERSTVSQTNRADARTGRRFRSQDLALKP